MDRKAAEAGDPEVSNRYWRERLKRGSERVLLPYDLPMRSGPAFHYAKVERKVEPRLDASLRQLARVSELRIGDIWCAGLSAVLARYGQGTEGTVSIGRAALGPSSRPRCADPIADLVLGFISSTAITEVNFDEDTSFRDILRLESGTNAAPPSTEVLSELGEADPSRMRPAIPVVYGDYPSSRVSAAGCDLAMALDPIQGLTLHYNTFRFSRNGANRIVGHIFEFLRAAVAKPDEAILKLEFLTENERESLESWNETKSDYPGDRCLHQLFEGRVEIRPETTAVVSGGEDISFGDLNERASYIAGLLTGLGVTQGATVTICAGRSIDLVASYLAVWKTGGICVPLDPAIPSDRLANLLQDVKSAAVIHDRHAPIASESSLKTVNLDKLGDTPEKAAKGAGKKKFSCQSEDSAFVVFSSGFTGSPNGIVLSHRALVNRVAWLWREWPFKRGEVSCSRSTIGSSEFIMEVLLRSWRVSQW